MNLNLEKRLRAFDREALPHVSPETEGRLSDRIASPGAEC